MFGRGGSLLNSLLFLICILKSSWCRGIDPFSLESMESILDKLLERSLHSVKYRTLQAVIPEVAFECNVN